jgi:hypothetical protein
MKKISVPDDTNHMSADLPPVSDASFLKLTEKDKRLLLLLGEAGAIKSSQAKMFYGNTVAYHLRCLDKLVRAGYLVRKNTYVQATPKGLQQAGYPGKPLRLAKHLLKEHSLAVEILTHFPEWQHEYNRVLKEGSVVERGSRISAVITKGKERYAVYVLTDILRPKTRKTMHSELVRLKGKGISKSLVFCTSQAIERTFGTFDEDALKKLDECCLLQYPAGIDLFRRTYSPSFIAFLKARFPGITPVSRPSAHYDWRNRTLITIMLHNDLIKRAALAKYVKSAQKTSEKPCIAVCYPGQDLDIPGVEVVYDESSE